MTAPMEDQILREMQKERDSFAIFSRTKLEQMDRAIEARRQASDGFHFGALGASSAEQPSSEAPQLPTSDEFNGMALPAMVHHVLELQPNRLPATATKILEVLEAHGVAPSTKAPLHSVQTALNRRKDTLGDVIHTGFGEWGLLDWYTESEIKKLAKVPDGANARDKAMHADKMKKGIAKVRARGAHYGKPPKITEEMWKLATKLINEDGYGITRVHQEVIKLTPEGIDPIGLAALSNRKKQFVAREPYPESWRNYFQHQKKVKEIKDSLDGNVSDLRVIK